MEIEVLLIFCFTYLAVPHVVHTFVIDAVGLHMITMGSVPCEDMSM